MESKSQLFARTDKQFHAKHPELNGRRLTNTPEDKAYRQEYVALLRENRVSSAKPQPVNTTPVAPCPNKQPVLLLPPPAKPCKAASITISLPNEKSAYKLVIPGPEIEYRKEKYKNHTTYELVSGPSNVPADVQVDAANLVGPCPEKHQSHTFNFDAADIVTKQKTDASLACQVHSRSFTTSVSIIAATQLIGYIFDRQSLDYRIQYATCGFDNTVLLRVFPKLEGTASASLKFEHQFGKKGKDSEKKSFGEHFECSAEIKHDTETLVKYEYGREKNEEGNDIISFLSTFLDNIDYLMSGMSAFLAETPTFKISIKPSFELKCALEQAKGKPFVGVKWSASLGCSPLIGFDYKQDFSGPMLLSLPVVGPFLYGAVRAAEATKTGEVFLGIIVKGSISLTGNVERSPEAEWEGVALNPKGKITFDLRGKVNSAMKIWKVQYSTGLQLGGTTGVEVEKSAIERDAKGVFFTPKVKFNGLIIYYQAWLEVSRSTQSNEEPDEVSGRHKTGVLGNPEAESAEDIAADQKMTLWEEKELFPGAWGGDGKVYFFSK